MTDDLVSAEYVQTPIKRAGLFRGRPWTVYYEGGTRASGKRIRCGMASFRLKREAIEFMRTIMPAINPKELPF